MLLEPLCSENTFIYLTGTKLFMTVTVLSVFIQMQAVSKGIVTFLESLSIRRWSVA